MTFRIPYGPIFDRLREKAECLLRQQGRKALPKEEEVDLMRLVHELEVQYVELELQNEELRRTSKDLETSRNAFSELYQSAPVGFVSLDSKGRIRQLNAAAARMLAGPEEFLTGELFLQRVHPVDRGAFHSYLAKISVSEVDAPPDMRVKGAGDRWVQVQVQRQEDECEAAGNGDVLWRLALVDISTRKQYEEALEKARRELETRVLERTAELERRSRQLARLTSELSLAEQRERRRLADLLHDHLQQTLAGARLHLEMLGEEHGLKQHQAFRDIYQLVMDAITTSRSLSAELSPPVLYLQGLSGALEWLARWMKQTHRLQVTVAVDPAANPQREDLKVLLFQSVRELLFNVVKHAGTPSARIEMTRREGRTRIVVSDRGGGFDAQAIWQRRPAVEGGFGLFSIRERLDLLGGRFDIASAAGRGTTATIDLPLQTFVESESAADIGGDPAPHPGVSAEAPPPETGSKIRILLVDDHAMMRKGLSLLLSGYGDIEIAGEAEDGRQAVALAHRIRPDVILMDINMPVMNGMEATRRIHAELPATRIIGLSMHTVEDQAEAMRAAGAVDYLNKGGSPNVLLSSIRKNAG
jgi:PAS domain S-box-containing protein